MSDESDKVEVLVIACERVVCVCVWGGAGGTPVPRGVG